MSAPRRTAPGIGTWVLLLLSLLLVGMAAAARADEPRSADRCLADPVVVVRAHGRPREARKLRLTHCDGRPNLDALAPLSILARPHGLERPDQEALEAAPDEDHVAPGIHRLHPGLLARLQALADRWPGRRIEIVSGYRPDARRTSRHHHGRALDLRVRGVSRREVSELARTLDNTGVGFYPNSVFTHVDVRHRRAYWVDRSAPGEPPDYGPWPERDDERDRAKERILADAFEALDRL
ncbi:MAG: YcbK family protein [Myxococcota bacterium]